MYAIIHKGKVIKRYPFKLQCVVWLYFKGLIVEGFDQGRWICDNNIKVVECTKTK